MSQSTSQSMSLFISNAKQVAGGFLVAGALAFSGSALAKDALDGTTWQAIDDETGKPKAVIKITEQEGKLVGRLVKSYQLKKNEPCKTCRGKYANKPLNGVPIFWNLTATGKNEYTGGTIFDPKKGKSYKLKGELVNGGKSLKLRGYVGSPMLGRTQTWQRVK